MGIRKEFNNELKVFFEESNGHGSHCITVRTTDKFQQKQAEIIIQEFKGKGNRISFVASISDFREVFEFLAKI